jgi:hypothetical protein
MVSSGYGYSIDPASLNDKLVALGPNAGFQGALVIPASLPNVLPRMIYKNFYWCRETPAPMLEIDTAIAGGKTVIIELDYSPSAGLQNHWIVLYQKKRKDYLLRDPYPYPSETTDVLLSKSRFAFAGGIENIITAALFLDGIKSTPEPGPALEPQSELEIYAIVDGLALRNQPHIATDNLLKRIPLFQRISVIESKDDALQKIGVVNQWINANWWVLKI